MAATRQRAGGVTVHSLVRRDVSRDDGADQRPLADPDAAEHNSSGATSGAVSDQRREEFPVGFRPELSCLRGRTRELVVYEE